MVFFTGADVLGIFLGRGRGGLAFTFGAATGGAFTGGLSGGAVSSGALCAGSGAEKSTSQFHIQQLSEPLDLPELVQRLNHLVQGDPINDVHPQP